MAAGRDDGAMGARVDALEAGVAGLRSDIGSLREAVIASQKTPWGTLISGAGFIVFITTAYSQLSLQGVNTRVDRSERDIAAINGAIVPRGEHEGHWANTDVAISNLQKQIDLQRQDFGATYSLKDALTQINKRLDNLEGKTK